MPATLEQPDKLLPVSVAALAAVAATRPTPKAAARSVLFIISNLLGLVGCRPVSYGAAGCRCNNV